ncbi:MAG TPA: FAD-binding oxidoreductase [Hyphomicrobiaceae bacterium]|nr:FAD-binding oxidoreductase [Hyphomicrobiaceae bacterium]
MPARSFPRLSTETQADVAVIGAGYTGLSAAHALAGSGLEPVILEAHAPGWGASGRNGGVVTAKFRPTFPAIAAAHGRDVAKRMNQMAHEAVDAVAELVDSLAIRRAAFTRTGQVKAAHNAASLRAAVAEAEWLKAELNDASMQPLTAAEVREETGSTAFVGGVRNLGSGGIHPLNYLYGLAEGVTARGIRLFAHSPVLRLRREPDGILLETPAGSVRARQVIIASNAYSDLTGATGAVERTVIPFRSAIIATEPLSANLAATIMPSRRTYSETRRMLRWFRMVDDRVLFGGRGAFGKADSAAAFNSLRTAMVGIFPELADVPLAYRWSGLVAMTLDQMPHVGRLDDRVLFALGYNGAGIAMASLMGRYLSAFARREQPDVGLLDARRLRRVPFYPIREPAIRLLAGWYQLLDAVGR